MERCFPTNTILPIFDGKYPDASAQIADRRRVADQRDENRIDPMLTFRF